MDIFHKFWIISVQ